MSPVAPGLSQSLALLGRSILCLMLFGPSDLAPDGYRPWDRARAPVAMDSYSRDEGSLDTACKIGAPKGILVMSLLGIKSQQLS